MQASGRRAYATAAQEGLPADGWDNREASGDCDDRQAARDGDDGKAAGELDPDYREALGDGEAREGVVDVKGGVIPDPQVRQQLAGDKDAREVGPQVEPLLTSPHAGGRDAP